MCLSKYLYRLNLIELQNFASHIYLKVGEHINEHWKGQRTVLRRGCGL